MKTALKIAALAAMSFGFAGQAFAQATQDVNITATVAPSCLINGLTAGTPLSTTVAVNSAGIVTGAATGGSHTVSNVVCNVAAQVQTSTLNGAVTTASPTAVGFQNSFDYTATAAFGGATSSINTASVAAGGTGTPGSTSGAASGNLVIGVTPTANASPLVAGSYADTLTVTITPTP